jgi:hypothetical protein
MANYTWESLPLSVQVVPPPRGMFCGEVWWYDKNGELETGFNTYPVVAIEVRLERDYSYSFSPEWGPIRYGATDAGMVKNGWAYEATNVRHEALILEEGHIWSSREDQAEGNPVRRLFLSQKDFEDAKPSMLVMAKGRWKAERKKYESQRTTDPEQLG